MPQNYYPGGDPKKAPVNNWRSVAVILFENWLRSLDRRAIGNSQRSLRPQAQYLRG
jgi:homoserine trans-succinylase